MVLIATGVVTPTLSARAADCVTHCAWRWAIPLIPAATLSCPQTSLPPCSNGRDTVSKGGAHGRFCHFRNQGNHRVRGGDRHHHRRRLLHAGTVPALTAGPA